MFNFNFKAILKIAFVFFLTLIGDIHADCGLPNISIRPKAQLKTIDIYAKALYWYTSETVDWAFTLQQSGNSVQTAYKTFTFDWAPGFCIGLGYNMEHDQLDTQLRYTWFRSKATDYTNGPVTPAFLAARLSFLEPFDTGNASLNLRYDMIAWDLGRSFLVSNHLCLRPAIGLRGGWISQTIHSNWTIDIFGIHSASEDIKQKFQGVGPTGGLIGKWCFGNIRKHSFSLIGQVEASYLWGHWLIQDKFTDNLFFTTIYINTLDRNFGSFVLRSFIGFGWDCNFNCDRFHFELKLGYEIEDWLDQFQIFSDASGSQNNNLILQGFNFSFRFDF
jgi:Legionella pneumophila major outer membrane protein precursor